MTSIALLVKGGHTAPLIAPSQQVVLHGGTAAMKHTPRGSQVRWNRGETTVHLDASIDQLGPSARDAVQNAFGTWLESDARLPSLKFDSSKGVQPALKPDGKNSVLVAPITVAGHEHDLAITLTYSDEVTGSVLEADIVINAKYAYRAIDRDRKDHDDDKGRDHDHDHDDDHSADDRSSCVASSSSCSEEIYDIQNVVTHEVGHFFGLGEDMDDTSATMYVCTNRCEVHKRELSEADKSVMTALYADANFSASGPESESETAAGCGARLAPRGNLIEAGLALLAGLVLLGRRKRQ